MADLLVHEGLPIDVRFYLAEVTCEDRELPQGQLMTMRVNR